jgi:hypothetical protein
MTKFGSGIRDLGSRMKKTGSGINIPDSQRNTGKKRMIYNSMLRTYGIAVPDPD